LKIFQKKQFNVMRYIIERKDHYKIGDMIILEYWYNDMLTVCKIVDIIGKKYLISHNVSNSKIPNAPDEIIKSSDIIDFSR
jgi:hypothetical protein